MPPMTAKAVRTATVTRPVAAPPVEAPAFEVRAAPLVVLPTPCPAPNEPAAVKVARTVSKPAPIPPPALVEHLEADVAILEGCVVRTSI